MSIDTTHIYAVPGDTIGVVCAPYLRPEGTVEMSGPNPNPRTHVASHDGTWVPMGYKTSRAAAILQAWTITDQLEALVEASDGRPEKLELLKQYIRDTKKAYPK